MTKFTGEIVGYDYSTYEPAWKTRKVFEVIDHSNPLTAEFNEDDIAKAFNDRFSDWLAKEVFAEEDTGMVSMNVIRRNGDPDFERCDTFFCDLMN